MNIIQSCIPFKILYEKAILRSCKISKKNKQLRRLESSISKKRSRSDFEDFSLFAKEQCHRREYPLSPQCRL